MTLSPDTAQVGFVGLGNIGQPMSRALLRDGWQLRVLDRDAAKAVPLEEEGARVVSEVSDLAECQVVALAVPDDAAVRSVLEGPGGLFALLGAGAAVVVHSTVLPATARELAAEADRHGVLWVDAPVSGGDERALAGELAVMVGAEPEAFDQVRPLLESVGSSVLHMGPPGAGAAAKLANQLVMFSALAGLHEALAMAGAYEVPEERVLEALTTGLGDTWVGRNWGFFDRVALAYDAGGTPVSERPWSKDLREAVEAGTAVGVDLPVARLLAQTLADRVEARAHKGQG